MFRLFLEKLRTVISVWQIENCDKLITVCGCMIVWDIKGHIVMHCGLNNIETEWDCWGKFQYFHLSLNLQDVTRSQLSITAKSMSVSCKGLMVSFNFELGYTRGNQRSPAGCQVLLQMDHFLSGAVLDIFYSKYIHNFLFQILSFTLQLLSLWFYILSFGKRYLRRLYLSTCFYLISHQRARLIDDMSMMENESNWKMSGAIKFGSTLHHLWCPLKENVLPACLLVLYPEIRNLKKSLHASSSNWDLFCHHRPFRQV